MQLYSADCYLLKNNLKINLPQKNRVENMDVQLDATQWGENSVEKLDLTTAMAGLIELRDDEEKVH